MQFADGIQSILPTPWKNMERSTPYQLRSPLMEYFVCLTDEAVAAFKSMCEQTGICAPMNGVKVLTYYGWGVENPDQWDAFPDVYNAFNERFEKLMRIENTLYESVKQARGE